MTITQTPTTVDVQVAEPAAVPVSAPARPVGACRCAGRLTEATGLPVEPEDIEILAEVGLLGVVDRFKGYALYDVAAVDAFAGTELLAELVTARRAWQAASIDSRAAAERLGWRYAELARDAAAHGVTPGKFGRYATADIEALAANPAFLGRRLLGPDQAAARFDVRRVDFEHAVVAGWITAAGFSDMPVGRKSTVRVPLYRAADVDALADIGGVDWNAVREVPPGKPSALREYVRRPPSRAQIIRRLAADIGARFGREVWAYHRPGIGWEIDWETVAGLPTRQQVAAAIAADPVARQYRRELALATEHGAAVNWARAMLEPGAAVILDTETTGLYGASIVEIAVIDAATGKTLLDTLVNPGRPIPPDALAIHGITDADVADAPTWAAVLPKLQRAARGRTVLCYNADFDSRIIAEDTARAGLNLGPLTKTDRWGCVMLRRSDWTRSWRWLPLGGGHRALGDAQAARDVLLEMTAPLGAARRR